MRTLSILRKRPRIFFRLSAIRFKDFESLACHLELLWEAYERARLSSRKRKRGIGAGNKHKLCFSSQLLMCLIYYRTYISHEFLGLLFGVSDSIAYPL